MASIAVDHVPAAPSLRLRFTLTIFVGSFLLFLVQPMLARMALPRLGGAPSVWNSAMLVYQGLLLAGYAYAHWLARLPGRIQGMIHVAAIAAAAFMLPIGLSSAIPSTEANSFVWVPWLLLTSIGPLFLVVSAQAPLLQRWYSLSGGDDPYPLYVASNLGSFSGLIFYPLVLEPLTGVASQSQLWTIGYAFMALCIVWCALSLAPLRAVAVAAPSTPVTFERRQVALWVVLAAIPSGLMLSTTLHLTTDVAPMPLLWVIPLGLYLLSFSAGFSEKRGLARLCMAIAPFTLLLTAACLFVTAPAWVPAIMLVALLNLFVVSVALHAMLFERRPEPAGLTGFYLALAVGGALGGLVCALIAPLLFNWTFEHPLLLIAAAAALGGTQHLPTARQLMSAPAARKRLAMFLLLMFSFAMLAQQLDGERSRALALFAMILLISLAAMLALGSRALFASAILCLLLAVGGAEKLGLALSDGRIVRSYFGVYTIQDNAGKALLIHGTTVHGVQLKGTAERERQTTAYYTPTSGVGQAMALVPSLYGPAARVSVVGLGTGTLSCYAAPQQRWTFYEIDPAVVDIARGSGRFTFLQRCKRDAEMVLGDARLRLAERPAGNSDVLVVDAFSSDAIPMHLLTREAFQSYGRYLGKDGLLLVHISNRYLELEPVVAAAARSTGWHAIVAHDVVKDSRRSAASSDWVAFARDPATLQRLELANPALWREPQERPGSAPWTDDYGSILPIIKALQR